VASDDERWAGSLRCCDVCSDVSVVGLGGVVLIVEGVVLRREGRREGGGGARLWRGDVQFLCELPRMRVSKEGPQDVSVCVDASPKKQRENRRKRKDSSNSSSSGKRKKRRTKYSIAAI